MSNPRRTSKELKNIEYNYFWAFRIELFLNNPEKIREKIKEVYVRPAGDLKSRRLLELKNDIEEIMINDAIYDEQTGEYKRKAGGRKLEMENARRLKLEDALKFLLGLCKVRKVILLSEIDDLAKRDNPNTTNKNAKFYTTDDLVAAFKDAIKDMPVKIIDNMDNSIPFNDYKKIDEQLEAVQKNTLYEFLGVAQNVSEGEIKQANQDRYAESSRFGGSKLKEKQLYSTLCGFCSKHLEDSARRKAYDQYILIKEPIWEQFKQRQLRGYRDISLDEFNYFIQLTMEILNVSLEEAEKIITTGCKYFTLYII